MLLDLARANAVEAGGGGRKPANGLDREAMGRITMGREMETTIATGAEMATLPT